jgi:hypothetical protein
MDVNTKILMDRIRACGPVMTVRCGDDFDQHLASQLNMSEYEPAELSRAVYALKNEGQLTFTVREDDLGTAGIINEPVTETVVDIAIR